MRQRIPVWIIVGALIAAGFVWFVRRARHRKEATAVRAPESAVEVSKPARSTTEPVALLSQPSPANFAEALATAYARQNRSRFPNRLSNTALPLKQLQARDTAIL